MPRRRVVVCLPLAVVPNRPAALLLQAAQLASLTLRLLSSLLCRRAVVARRRHAVAVIATASVPTPLS